MSVTRQFFRDMAPLFRMLEQPFGRNPAFHGPRNILRFDPIPDFDVRPAVDIAEQGDRYILDAELPGVNKDNIDIRVGDGGRSVTIAGKVGDSSVPMQPSSESNGDATTDPVALTNREVPTQLSTEREFSRNLQFTRTVWLPCPVDAETMSAKLENGVLTILAKKVEDKTTTSIPIQ